MRYAREEVGTLLEEEAGLASALYLFLLFSLAFIDR